MRLSRLLLLTLICTVTVLTPRFVNGQDATEEAPETPAVQPGDTNATLPSLARYLPYGAPIYVATRSDDAFLDTLDALYGEVIPALPADMTFGFPESVRGALDFVLAELPGTTFEADVRPWLGETIAVGVPSFDNLTDFDFGNDDEPPIIILLSSRDAEAAGDFFQAVFVDAYDADNFTRRDGDGFSVFTPPFAEDPSVLITSDAVAVALEANLPLALLDNPDTATLLDYPQFNEALGKLPAESYNVAAYIDTPQILSYLIASDFQLEDEFGERLLYGSLLKILGPLAAGATLLDDRTLAIDVAQIEGNLIGLEALGLDIGNDFAIDPAFISALPGDTAAVIHGTRITGGIDLLSANLSSVINGAAANAPDAELGQSVADSLVRAMTGISDATFSNLTGLDLERDLLNWIGEDYLIFLRYNPLVDLDASPELLPTDLGIIFEVTDPATSRAAMATLARDLPLTLRSTLGFGYSVRQERINDAEAITIVREIDPFFEQMTPLEITIAADDNVFVIGTRAAVVDVLSGEPYTGAFVGDSETVILDDVALAAYFDMEQMIQIGRFVGDLEFFRAIDALTLVETGSASMTITDEGDTLLRFTLTLLDPEAYAEAIAAQQVDSEAVFATATALREALDTAATESAVQTITALPTLMVLPTLTASPTLTPSPTISATPVPTETFTPSPTLIPTEPPPPSPSLMPTATITNTPVLTPPMQVNGSVPELQPGEPFSAQLSGDEGDLYAYRGQGGNAITISVVSEEFDAVVEIYDEGGVLLALDDDSGGDYNPTLTDFVLPVDGRYIVRVLGWATGSQGGYTITLAQGAAVTPTVTAVPTDLPTLEPVEPEPPEDNRNVTSRPVIVRPENALVVGLAASLTPAGLSGFSIDIRRGVELALSERPRITVDGQSFLVILDVQDDSCSTEGGAVIADYFTRDPQVVGVIGPVCSTACLAAAPVFDTAGYTTISPSCTRANLTESGFTSFNRTVVSDGIQGTRAAEFVFNNLGVRRIAVIDDGSAYGESLVAIMAAAFEDFGGEVVAREQVQPGRINFNVLLDEIEGRDPELIYFGGYVVEAAFLTQQRDSDVLFMGADGIATDEFVVRAGGSAEGVYATAPSELVETETVTALIARYLQIYQEEPSSRFYAHAYDATNVLLDAVEAVGEIDATGSLVVDRDLLSDYVRTLEGYDGLTGLLTADGSGETAPTELDVFIIEDGEFVEIE